MLAGRPRASLADLRIASAWACHSALLVSEATGEPAPQHPGHETDLTALEKGYVTLTPLDFDLTSRAALDEMKCWNLKVSAE